MVMKKIVLALFLVLFLVGTAFAGLNINTANEEQLRQLPGIGPVTATAIVEYREQNGNFGSVDDLVKVRGVGPRTLENLRDQIKVED